MLCTTTLFIGGCYRDTPEQDLEKPVFINDVNNPGLPVASELGYNTFGAYYNSKIWISSKTQNYVSPDDMLTIGTTEDSTVIHLEGIDYANQPLEVAFLITKHVIVNDDDLASFGKRSFDLKGDSVKIRIGGMVINVQSGSINFSSVRSLILNREKMGTILSGTFEMTGMLNGNKVELKKGRFDFLVKSQPYFYNYIGQW
jgi:hypothetical protein